MTTKSFRDYLFPHDDPRINSLKSVSSDDYLEAAKKDAFAGPMIRAWAELYPEPFRGISNDGIVQNGLFPLQSAAEGLKAPVAEMVAAAGVLLGSLDETNLQLLQYPVDAHEWRSWANPEFTQFPIGVRLEKLNPRQRAAALAVVSSSLSDEGFALARDLMRVNAFLGNEVGLPQLMNEFSYQFALFGEPSLSEPWGWNLFGHHVALNCLVVDGRMVLSPVFLGGEPSSINEPPFENTQLFEDRIYPARELMKALSTDQRDRAISFTKMIDPAMPEGRLHPGDERHLGGCFQDNRVIPYEGVLVSDFEGYAQIWVEKIVEAFLSVMPVGPRELRLAEVRNHWTETWFSWIGGWGPNDAFYYRVQSPVAIFELDHHTGVFLNNTEPAQFHIHTVMRTPNGNDYGRSYVEQRLGRPLIP